MLPKNKFKIIAIVICIFIIFIALIFYFIKQKANAPTSTKTIPQIQLESQYKGKYKIELLVKKDELKLPKEVHSLIISNQPLGEDYVASVALKLGFSGDPYRTEDITKGAVVFWQNDKASLFCYPASRRIEYSSYMPYDSAINKQLSDEAVVNVAKAFLIDNGVFDATLLEPVSITHLVKSSIHEGFDKTTSQNATLSQVDFYPKNAGYEIVTKNPDDYAISVKILKDGTVWNVQIIKFDFSSEEGAVYQSRQYEEIVSSLSESVLTSLTGQQLSAFDLPENSIETISIKEITPAYLLESYNTDILLPILLLKGTAKVAGIQNDLNATLYLSAISSKK